ncbi:tannase and feruloyl esterase [Wilcoxina mikolae CBS 423.85]|nr:tannase and feruloyl esterase [Wilcoxina mikolae CBS 423.85]
MFSLLFFRISALALAVTFPSLSQSRATPRYGGADYCYAFGKGLVLEDTQVLNTTYHSVAQTIAITSTDPTCDQTAQVPLPLCRITLLVTTSPSSKVEMEIWLPDEWSQRIGAVGNGGLNGCVDHSSLTFLSSFNFAVIGSNNGHDGTGGASFLNSPEVLKDFAYRAIHTEAVVSKEIVKKYYSYAAKKSYYVGCSTGGRQGFKMIEDFPDDFDGVLAGAPAIDFNHLLGWGGIMSRLNGAPSGIPIISPALWQVVTLDMLAQCDLIDGVLDGIIDNPDLCDYDPAGLLCTNILTENCLTNSQIEIVRKVFSPITGPDGELEAELIYPRYDPGMSFLGTAQLYFSGLFSFFALDWWKYAIYNDTSFDGSSFGLKDLAAADKVDPAGVSTWNPDLSSYANRGGKVLTYHGRRDSLIPSGNSIRWYNLVQLTMGQHTMDNFYRFFPIPGMDHCSGGPGANSFAQLGYSFEGLPKDKQYNALLALVDWVENGNAPESIIGTKFVNDNVTLGIDSQRLHCALPKKSWA